jgi:hypothetical protein
MTQAQQQLSRASSALLYDDAAAGFGSLVTSSVVFFLSQSKSIIIN